MYDPNGNKVLKSYIDNLLEGPKDMLQSIEDRIPSMVKANKEMMQQIIRCKKHTKESRSLYESMMEGIEALKQQLTDYGHGEIFVNDFKSAAIKLRDPTDRSGTRTMKVSDFLQNSSSRTSNKVHESRGLWTVMENGVLNNEDNIYVRMYLVSANVENTYSEVSKLR